MNKSIRSIAERQQKLHRVMKTAMIVVAVLLPFALYLAGAMASGEKMSWSLEPIRESVVSGRFLSDPGAALFQQSQLISKVSSDSHVVETIASYVLVILMTLVVLSLVIVALRLLIGMLFRQGDRLRQMIVLRSATPMTTKVLKAMAIGRGEELKKSPERSWIVASAGRSIVVQTVLEKPLFPILITSVKHSLESREKIRLPKDALYEAVVGKVAYAHFHGYVPKSGSGPAVAARVFNRQVTARLIKYLDNADIFVEYRSVVAVFDSATIQSDVDFDRHLDALENVIRELQKNIRTGGGLPLPKRRIISRERLPLIVLLAVIVAYGVVTFFIPAGPTVSDLMVVAAGMGWVYIWLFWRVLSRRRNFMSSEWREL